MDIEFKRGWVMVYRTIEDVRIDKFIIAYGVRVDRDGFIETVNTLETNCFPLQDATPVLEKALELAGDKNSGYFMKPFEKFEFWKPIDRVSYERHILSRWDNFFNSLGRIDNEPSYVIMEYNKGSWHVCGMPTNLLVARSTYYSLINFNKNIKLKIVEISSNCVVKE